MWADIEHCVYCSFLDRPGRASDRVWTEGGDADQPLRKSVHKLVKGVLSDVVCVVVLAHFLVRAYSVEEDKVAEASDPSIGKALPSFPLEWLPIDLDLVVVEKGCGSGDVGVLGAPF